MWIEMFSQYSKPNLFGSGVHRLQRYTLETNWQGPLDLEFYCFVRHFLFLSIFPFTFRADVQAKIAKISHHSLSGKNLKRPTGLFSKKKTATQPSIFFSHTTKFATNFLSHVLVVHHAKICPTPHFVAKIWFIPRSTKWLENARQPRMLWWSSWLDGSPTMFIIYSGRAGADL